jgi:acyl-CoA thioester hydrolase
MDNNNYKHKITEIVKFHEVDMLGVCNNAVYFNYFEDARIKYLQDLSKQYKLKKFLVGDSFFIMVHNEIDYINSAHLDDQLNVFTKICKVSNSSFSFEHYIQREGDNTKIAKGAGIVVHIDKVTKKSQPLPEEFHRAVLDFEGV